MNFSAHVSGVTVPLARQRRERTLRSSLCECCSVCWAREAPSSWPGVNRSHADGLQAAANSLTGSKAGTNQLRAHHLWTRSSYTVSWLGNLLTVTSHYPVVKKASSNNSAFLFDSLFSGSSKPTFHAPLHSATQTCRLLKTSKLPSAPSNYNADPDHCLVNGHLSPVTKGRGGEGGCRGRVR